MVTHNKTLLNETKYISFVVGILSVALQLVFVAVSKWNIGVLLANVYSDLIMIANFYFMGLSVVKAVDKDEKEAQKIMRTSLTVRTFGLFVGITIGVLVPFFNIFAVVIPLFFNRIAIALRPVFKIHNMKEDENESEIT